MLFRLNKYIASVAPMCVALAMLQPINSYATPTDSNKEIEALKQPNILIFLIDDMRVDLGAYGKKQVHSPNIDKLASEGVSFNHAYAQQAICGPSRVSIMTGLRPETTGLYTIDRSGRLRPNQPNIVSMPQLFKQNGYKTISVGKVYHSSDDDKENWTNHIEKLPNFYSIPSNAESKFAFEAGDVSDSFYKDGKVAIDAIEILNKVKNDKFLMIVGFSKPHLPFNSPRKYWEMYDREKFIVPSREKPKNMFKLSLTQWNELRMYGGIPKQGDVDDELTKTLIHAYYASVSYMDAQLGKVMTALNDLKLRENTMVIFMSDHGYKLGEYGAWNKHSNMELDTRVPLIISRELNHKTRQAGISSNALVENIDIFPSIVEASGLPLPEVDGKSLLTLVDSPNMQSLKAAYSLYPRGKIMGVSVTDGEWRYIEWRNAETQNIEFKELYSHKLSDVAQANVSGQIQYQNVEHNLKQLLDGRYPLDAPSFYVRPVLSNNDNSVR